jgi:hypothetical protein
MIQHWGRDLATDFDVEMQFSEGWLTKFFNRHGLVLRKATNKPVHSDSRIANNGARFVCHLKSLIFEYNNMRENIYSLDETALFFDHGKDTTVDLQGSKHIPVCVFTKCR